VEKREKVHAHFKIIISSLKGLKFPIWKLALFIKDFRHGNGRFIFASGAKYSGNFVENTREGLGVYTYPDGSFYQGEWKDDKMHGLGCFTFKNGSKFEAEWENGNLIPSSVVLRGQK